MLQTVARAVKEDLETPVQYEVSFMRNQRGQVITDRRFNTASLMSIYLGKDAVSSHRMQWNPDDPNTLVMNLPGGAAFVVDHDLRYQLAGGEALEQAGFTAGTFVGRHLDEVLPPELAEEYTPLYRQVLAGQPFIREHEAHDRVYLSRGVPLRNDQGEVYAALAVSYDVTERRRAESALRDSEERHALLLRHRLPPRIRREADLRNAQQPHAHRPQRMR